jgi:hypothetical protein
LYIPHKMIYLTPSFPNQNVYNNRFLINHYQLSVNYHRKQTYQQIIHLKYNVVYPSVVTPYTLYDSIYKPVKIESPSGE